MEEPPFGTFTAQGLDKRRDIRGRIADLPPLGCEHTRAGDDALGHDFIHGHAARERAGARVGHAKQFKRGLDLSVLPVGPVQAEEHAVGQTAELQNARSETARALVPPGGDDRCDIRGLMLDADIAAEAVRHIKGLIERPAVILQSEKCVHKDGLVPALSQRLADRGRRHQRDMPLRTQAAAQHHDFHCITPQFF